MYAVLSLGGVLARIFIPTIMGEIYILSDVLFILCFGFDGSVVSGLIFFLWYVYSTSAILCLDNYERLLHVSVKATETIVHLCISRILQFILEYACHS
jgi:hypothetical protein